MSSQQRNSKTMHIILWVAQVLLATLLLSGFIMKFLPIEKISAIMPWTGQVPALVVRLLGIIDFLGAIGLILPTLLSIKPQLTPWTALGIIALMVCAIIFHVSRGEILVIGVNVFCLGLAVFIAWGRFKKAPVSSK